MSTAADRRNANSISCERASSTPESFFLRQGVRDLRELTRGVVVAYMEHLQEEVGNAPGHAGRRVDYLSPATQRKYLLALGNMLKRARSNGIIHTNFVADVLAAANC